MQRRTEAVIVR